MRTHTRDTGTWIKYGAIGGFVADIVFAMFEMIMAAVLNGACFTGIGTGNPCIWGTVTPS